jgi:MFS family permease
VQTPGNRRRSLIAIIVGAGTQLNGVLLINYYLTLVLNTVGITSTREQTVINGGLQTWKWMSSVLGAMLVDRIGRRSLYLMSTFGKTISLRALSERTISADRYVFSGCLCSYIVWTACSATYAKDPTNTAAAGSVVGFIFIFSFFYATAWINLLVAYPCEIFPYRLRAKGLALTLTFNYVINVVSLFVNPIAMKAIVWKYYIVFCIFLVVILMLIWVFFPETKGHSLEEIARIFDKDIDGVDAMEGGKDQEEYASKIEQVELK